jgi:alpha-beta hydrolase superfamily lysophospholipase
MWTLYRLGTPDGQPFPASRHPVAALDTLMKQHVPRWFSTIPAAADALVAVLDRIGPAVVISHSNGGLIAFEAAWRRPDLVAGVPFLFMMGDNLDATPLWRGLSTAMTDLAARLAAVGARVTDWRLPEMGIHGNTHMPMMDDNSDDLAARIVGWIEAEIA